MGRRTLRRGILGGRPRRGRAPLHQERRQLRAIGGTTVSRLRRDLRHAHRHLAASRARARRRDQVDLRSHQRRRRLECGGGPLRAHLRPRRVKVQPDREQAIRLHRHAHAVRSAGAPRPRSRSRKSPTRTSRWAASINAAAIRSTCSSSRPTTSARSRQRLQARGSRFAAHTRDEAGLAELFIHPSAFLGVLIGVSRTEHAWTWSGDPERAKRAAKERALKQGT